MGAGASLTANDLTALEKTSKLNKTEIKKIFKRFQRFTSEESATVPTERLYEMPEFLMNPLTPKLLHFFDSSSTGQVEFTDFVTTLAVFSETGTVKEKTLFAFKLFDNDGDGFIYREDMFPVMKMLLGSVLTDAHINEVVDSAFEVIRPRDTSRISFEDFCKIVSSEDLGPKFTMDSF
eukprot:Nk52_evm2s164 gene=Nk52_evmTU2s164